MSTYTLAKTRLIHNIIREYGMYKHHSLSIDIDHLALVDKKLLLSYYAGNEEYTDALTSAMMFEVVFDEYKAHMQHELDDECNTVYHEAMEEAGMRMCVHPNHDEVYWVRA